MKTLRSMISEAESKRQLWLAISNDPDALKDRGKTKEEAVILANYFEGKYDGLCDVSKEILNRE